MNIADIQAHLGDNKKAGAIFKILKSHLQSTEITEKAGVSIYNYDIVEAIKYFMNLAVDRTRTRTDKQFWSYDEMIDLFKEMREKGIR
ncbi:hypothetical protein KA005_20295 [bacterium]|nr:hypothetical protein [bacterium]